VERGRIVAKVTATGTLSAIVTVQVGSQVSGRIQALYADYNSRVKKGQLIAKIDPQLFQAAQAQARANLAAAEGNLARARAQALDAERQYGRARALAAEKLVAQADLDAAQAAYEGAAAGVKAAQGSVEQARAALHQTQVNLEYTNILSPTDGVVISRSVDVGQTVAASLQAPTLFVIAEDLSKMQVDTSVAEADVGRLRDGMAASFTVDA
jgi:HlyD family secretion protein